MPDLSCGPFHRAAIATAIFWQAALFAQTPAPAPSAPPKPPLHDQSDTLLKDALADKNPDTRKAAVQSMSLICMREPYLSQVKSMLDDKDVEVRLATITSLVDLENKSTVGTLETALDDEVPEVSLAAAKALWSPKDPAATPCACFTRPERFSRSHSSRGFAWRLSPASAKEFRHCREF